MVPTPVGTGVLIAGGNYNRTDHNHTTDNHMGFTKDGQVRHNGLDHWWDDQGLGNCWERNRSSHGEATHNFVVPPGSCNSGGSILPPGLPVKDADFLTCSEYDRADPIFRHPPLCTWLDDPQRPSAGSAAGRGAAAPATDSAGPTALLSVIGGATLVIGLRRSWFLRKRGTSRLEERRSRRVA